jgi:hypothetical protein
MTEKEYKNQFEKKYEGVEIKESAPILSEQVFSVFNRDGNEILRHEIFAVGPGPTISSFGLDGDERFQGKRYYMFGSTMGYPSTSSIQIPTELKESGLRYDMFLLSETEFYKNYFEKRKLVIVEEEKEEEVKEEAERMDTIEVEEKEEVKEEGEAEGTKEDEEKEKEGESEKVEEKKKEKVKKKDEREVVKNQYLRYVCDFAFDDWHEQNIHRIVEELNAQGVKVSILKEEYKRYHDIERPIYHAILLFEEGNTN